jgi:hypothetical protein
MVRSGIVMAKKMMWGKLKHGQSSNQRNVYSEQKSKMCGCYCSAATHSTIVHCPWAVVLTKPLTFLHKLWHWQTDPLKKWGPLI